MYIDWVHFRALASASILFWFDFEERDVEKNLQKEPRVCNGKNLAKKFLWGFHELEHNQHAPIGQPSAVKSLAFKFKKNNRKPFRSLILYLEEIPSKTYKKGNGATGGSSVYRRSHLLPSTYWVAV